MPLLIWFIILFSAANAVWHLFALSGISLMDPSDTMGRITETGATAVQAKSALSALLFAALAVLTWTRSRFAFVVCLALIPLTIFGWLQGAQLADRLPDMPAAMLAIWAFYRVLTLAVLAAMAAYLWRLFRRDRLT